MDWRNLVWGPVRRLVPDIAGQYVQSAVTIHIRDNSLLNLPEGCRYDLQNEMIIGSTALLAYSIIFDPLYGAGALSGWGELDRKDKRKIVFEYTYSDPTKPTPTQPLKDTFIGRRH